MKNSTIGKFPKISDRGFGYYKFKDQYGRECSLNESSAARQKCIWLGTKDEAMHLNQKDVAELIPLLQHFVETGHLPRKEEV